MPKPKIPKEDIVLGSLEEAARLELTAQVESILARPKRRLALLGAFAFLALGLLVAGARNLYQVNTQGIAYILLAKHYVAGDFGLAVSSYWSPLLSWLIAPGLKAGWSDLVAARVVMGLSGALFWVGSAALLFLSRLPARLFLVGIWLAAFAAVSWSVEHISPDLLGAALLLLGTAGTFAAVRFKSTKAAIAAGVLFGVVYYVYAPFFPVAMVSLAGFALAAKCRPDRKARGDHRFVALQGGVALAVMLPWWGVLSLHNGYPIIGSVWAIDRAVAGPSDVERYHPCFGRLHPPAEGRLADWENPARGDYVSWPLFTDAANWSHQWNLLKVNLRSMLKIFLGFGALGVGILALAACFVFRPPLNRSLFSDLWRWIVFPVGGAVLAFLPLAVTEVDVRYFYSCYPLMLTAAFGFLEWLPQHFALRRFPKGFSIFVAAILFALPLVPRLAVALEGRPHPGGYFALELVERMQAARISGTVAGKAMLMGSRTGLYIACLLNKPWFGDLPEAAGADYLSCGAEIIIVCRWHRVNSDMEFNPAFRDLDAVLFPDEQQAEEFPLRVYQVNR